MLRLKKCRDLLTRVFFLISVLAILLAQKAHAEMNVTELSEKTLKAVQDGDQVSLAKMVKDNPDNTFMVIELFEQTHAKTIDSDKKQTLQNARNSLRKQALALLVSEVEKSEAVEPADELDIDDFFNKVVEEVASSGAGNILNLITLNPVDVHAARVIIKSTLANQTINETQRNILTTLKVIVDIRKESTEETSTLIAAKEKTDTDLKQVEGKAALSKPEQQTVASNERANKPQKTQSNKIIASVETPSSDKDKLVLKVPEAKFAGSIKGEDTFNATKSDLKSVKSVISSLTGKLVTAEQFTKDPTNISIFINFATAKAVIPPQYFSQLDEIGKGMTKLEGYSFEIGGFTDQRGSDISNMRLSEKRAESVRQYLIKNFKINPERLISKGYGNTVLLDKSNNESGWKKNRRVVITSLNK